MLLFLFLFTRVPSNNGPLNRRHCADEIVANGSNRSPTRRCSETEFGCENATRLSAPMRVAVKYLDSELTSMLPTGSSLCSLLTSNARRYLRPPATNSTRDSHTAMACVCSWNSNSVGMRSTSFHSCTSTWASRRIVTSPQQWGGVFNTRSSVSVRTSSAILLTRVSLQGGRGKSSPVSSAKASKPFLLNERSTMSSETAHIAQTDEDHLPGHWRFLNWIRVCRRDGMFAEATGRSPEVPANKIRVKVLHLIIKRFKPRANLYIY